MDLNELRLQRLGYVSAFRDPALLTAIASGPLRRIAVTYVEWAGVSQHWTLVPWTIIEGRDSASTFADQLENSSLAGDGHTSMSLGLLFSARQFEQTSLVAIRNVIDVSGDGPSDHGPPITDVRDFIVARGITINGLPLSSPVPRAALDSDLRTSSDGRIDINAYYQDCVIGGSGAFIMPVNALSQFAGAIRRKLILEIAGSRPRIIAAASRPTAALAVECQPPDLPPGTE